MKPVVKRPITIKLVILYILDKYKSPISEDTLSTIMLSDIEVNFFDYRESLGKLEETGYVYTYTDEGTEYHRLTKQGKELADETYKKVAYELRLNIADYIKREKRKILLAKEFVCNIYPISDTSFGVKVEYTEFEEELMTLSFRTGSREASENIKNALRAKKGELYKEINNALSKVIDI
ncbi:MAG: DUF4364 family protein [Clostridia bacterium]|nr:DUF4364 family protein [Clostridia bacterium]